MTADWRAAGTSVPRSQRPWARSPSESRLAGELLGWAPAWGLDESLEATVGWYTALAQGDDLRTFSETQIDAFAAVPA
jgi:hypothetical protein